MTGALSNTRYRIIEHNDDRYWRFKLQIYKPRWWWPFSPWQTVRVSGYRIVVEQCLTRLRYKQMDSIITLEEGVL